MIFMQNSGQVGAAPKLRIRGTSTVLGNREPLWVLDGVVLTDPVNVDPAQINDLDFVNLLGNAISGLNPDDIELESDLALIAVVGRGMRQTRGTAGRIFSALAHAHVNVKMIDQGSSELNIIIGVREHDFEAAIKAIYDIFVVSQL